jgi:hypothetical protein
LGAALVLEEGKGIHHQGVPEQVHVLPGHLMALGFCVIDRTFLRTASVRAPQRGYCEVIEALFSLESTPPTTE